MRTNDGGERDDRDCGESDEPCSSPDCGRCHQVCNGCGGDHGNDEPCDGAGDDPEIEDRSVGFDVSDLDGVRW